MQSQPFPEGRALQDIDRQYTLIYLLVYDVAHRLAMILHVWWHLACMSTGALCADSQVALSCLSTNGVIFASHSSEVHPAFGISCYVSGCDAAGHGFKPQW